MEFETRIAKPISYGNKRDLSSIKYIVIHYTGNKGDTAKNNADYFATSNTRAAGAHFFIDKKGIVYKSINMNRIAWSVGGFYTKSNGAGKYYQKCTNANSVSIELCDCIKETSWEQMLATRKLVLYIQKKCPNAKEIVRHWDCNGKPCPLPMIGNDNEKWELFHTFITKGYQFKAEVIKKSAIRSSRKVTLQNKIGIAEAGQILKITKVSGKWVRIKGKSKEGEWQWIKLTNIKKI